MVSFDSKVTYSTNYKVLSLYTTCHLFRKNHRILIYARLPSHQVLNDINFDSLFVCLFVCL